jgi:Predicted membrane protein (DUF2142)
MIGLIPLNRDSRRSRGIRVPIALSAGLVLIAVAVTVSLSRSPLVLAGTNGVAPAGIVVTTGGGTEACQTREVLPAGTTTIRLWVGVNIGPEVKVGVGVGLHVITRGKREAGWTGAVVAVPVRPVRRTYSNVRVCFKFGPATEEIWLVGAHTNRREGGLIGAARRKPKAHEAGAVLLRKMRIEYLRPGGGSWLARAQSIAQRMGLGRAPSGAWVALIPIALMLAAAVLTSWLILAGLRRRRPTAGAPIAGGAQTPTAAPLEQGRPTELQTSPPRGRTRALRVARGLPSTLARVPAAAWICASVACLSAASWSIVSPPFQVPDEPSHFAYVQELAEAHQLPNAKGSEYPQQELVVLEDLDHLEVRFNPAVGTISTAAQQQRLQSDLHRPLSRLGGSAGVAASQPPLYYALQTIPYYLGAGGTLLDRLALMRLLSALMAGLTALFVFLFLREALPRAPWVWTVGGLCVALAPLLGYMSGAVNPDSMLATVSAATFYCLARAFRLGLTRRRAIAIGLVASIGLLTKLNYVGLIPGVMLALVLIAHRSARGFGRAAAYRRMALAIAIPTTPVCVYIAVNLLSNHPGLGLVSSAVGLTNGHHGSILKEASYIWQYFLPRLPGMANDFPGISTTRQIWFDRSVGLYGWLDVYFPVWVYTVALLPAGLIAALFLRALLASRRALRRRAGELLAYAVIGLGVLVLIGADSYLAFPERAGSYSEPRYLLPMAALFAAVLALAARGAGRRWGPSVGTLLILMFLAYDIFSQLLVVGRYYY